MTKKMQYISTRGDAKPALFDQVLFDGLAPDGGLYLPQTWPSITAERGAAIAAMSYPEQAWEITRPFVEGVVDEKSYRAIVYEAAKACGAAKAIPLRPIGDNMYVLELFHGPSAAFKDFALQFLGRLFDHFLEKRKTTMTVLGATSGDTGSAAIASCGYSRRMRVFILHPHGRISPIQRRQMTTVESDRVFNIAVEGNFDDCQNIVKDLFADTDFHRAHRLGAVNSINWARIMAQMVYYVHAALRLVLWQESITFSVPTGNFGNMFSAYGAMRMGLGVSRLIAATNSNDTLAQCLKQGELVRGKAKSTVSPSMDIGLPSNFERQIFESEGGDGSRVKGMMQSLATDAGRCDVDVARMREIIAAEVVDDEETLATIRHVRDKAGIFVDPHTAVGIAAALRHRDRLDGPIICLATAHPAKFPEAMALALAEDGPGALSGVYFGVYSGGYSGSDPGLRWSAESGPVPVPDCLRDLASREERYERLPASTSAVADYIRARDHD